MAILRKFLYRLVNRYSETQESTIWEHNGKLYKITCSKQEEQDLYQPGVTSTPPTSAPGSPTSTQPGQQPPASTGQWQLSFDNADGWMPSPPHNKLKNYCDCGQAVYHSNNQHHDSCRKSISSIGLNDYTIVTRFDIGDPTDKGGSNQVEIVSGGPGVGHSGCCAVGMVMDISTGMPLIEIENWSPGAKNRDDYPCRGEGCKKFGWDGISLGPLYRSTLILTWRVSHPGGQVRYDGWASANGKTTYIGALQGSQATPLSGQYKGQIIDPRHPLMMGKAKVIEGRVRIDGSNNTKVYVPHIIPGSSSFQSYGNLGYIDEGSWKDLLY